jgi:hypothetical protein
MFSSEDEMCAFSSSFIISGALAMPLARNR